MSLRILRRLRDLERRVADLEEARQPLLDPDEWGWGSYV